MATCCEFETSGGKKCTTKKKGDGCPPWAFFCQRHLNTKSVQNMIKKFDSKFDKNKNNVVIPQKKAIPRPEKVGQSVFRLEKTDVNKIHQTVAPVVNREIRHDKPKTLNEKPKTIFNTNDDEERQYYIDILNEKDVPTDDIVPLDVIPDDNFFSVEEPEEIKEEPQDKSKPPVSKDSIRISKYLEMGYWITIHGLEKRVEYMRGYKDDLQNNEVIRNNLSLAFQEIIFYMGLNDDIGVESPCLIVAGTMLYLLFFRLMENGALDSIINKFYTPRNDLKPSKMDTQVNVNEGDYSDIF